jgi:NADPH:quinone reductase-like Zn-dependent oxidoreductase
MLGAKHVFDYKDPDVVKKIQAAVPDLGYVFDTIGANTTSVTASRAIRASGGSLCTVRPGKTFTDDVASHVQVTDVLVWTAFFKDHSYGSFKWPVSVDIQAILRRNA